MVFCLCALCGKVMLMKNIIFLNKKEGETPLGALENFRARNVKYKDAKMTYAGRLDPMASGLLLLLSGEEIKNKEKYLNLEKEYEFEVLFGFGTDTYDILGKVVSSSARGVLAEKKELEKQIKKNIKSFMGEQVQKYPMYSSKTVLGKPLFAYARLGEGVAIPERKITIKKIKFIKIKELNNKKLLTNIEKRIGKVRGDFRQDEILRLWRKTLNVKHSVFNIGSFKISCSSGTYVRVVANSLGEKFGIPALAFSIKRTKIGKYVI